MEKTTITLYAASQKVWGATHSHIHYFETIKERNAFVRDNDYTDNAGTVKLTDAQYADYKRRGTWDEQWCYED